MKLSFTGYRVLSEESELTDVQRAQIEAEGIFDDAQETAEEGDIAVEYVDIVDESGTTRYQGYFWPFGSAVFFPAGEAKMVADAVQHSFHRCEDLELWAALGDAYARADPKLNESISFKPPKQR